MNDVNDTYRIRPAGRHILTIGRDLIQDSYAAVVELVKNAYDADSSNVDITFQAKPDRDGYSIIISDTGHGMSRNTVINKWMVPSTRDKLDRQISPSGRIMQGRKGVGRYAASILGFDLLLETTTQLGEKTVVYVEWDNFDNAEYLDDVEILIETTKELHDFTPGTKLFISGNADHLEEWNQALFDKLRFELKRLISPIDTHIGAININDSFSINVEVNNFPNVQNINERIEPYPIFDLFDYKISGQISSEGKGFLKYSLQKARNTIDEVINFDLNGNTLCGQLNFDIRVYDREKESIETLIGRGLKDEGGNYVGKLQARQLLNQSNGIGVYRNGFRIRPLGDPDFDWLKLNAQRVQNPSLRIGSNQVIGYVQIQSEEFSGLIEKSARDGLKENLAFERLKTITKSVIAKLEERRFDYRKKVGLSRAPIKIEQELERLFSFTLLKEKLKKKLTSSGLQPQMANEILELINKEEEEKNKSADEIRQAVATYQGQATLGKIINVVLHEGRRPLNFFRNEIPRIKKLNKRMSETKNPKIIEDIEIITDGVSRNASLFSDLFKRLDPLAAGKRGSKKALNMHNELRSCVDVFRQQMIDNNITFNITASEEVIFSGWSQDIHSIFVNLIDNSIFWMNEKNKAKKEININIVSENSELSFIDFKDTGPGIEVSHIMSSVIFDPVFTTKNDGTGIGLAIAGEAAARNGLELKALESNDGAYFRIQIKDDNDE